MVVGAIGARVEQREENLRHLPEILVAKATEDEGAWRVLGQLSDRSTQCPGAGGVVGYVQQQAGTFGEADKFEAARPFGVADARFNRAIRYFVTVIVTWWSILG